MVDKIIKILTHIMCPFHIVMDDKEKKKLRKAKVKKCVGYFQCFLVTSLQAKGHYLHLKNTKHSQFQLKVNKSCLASNCLFTSLFALDAHTRKMACNKLLLMFSLLPSLLLLSISPCVSENVTVSVYYETLCPYCADFIVNHLVKLFRDGLSSIVNLRMIPWGNALIQPDGAFVCQHGPGECLLNTIEACTIAVYPNVVQHFKFIYCVEHLTLQKREAEWTSCFDTTRLSKAPINCYRNGYGRQLEQKHAAETAQLNPPHIFVPWVVVNNQPLREDFLNIVNYVCKAYRGNRLPKACRSPSKRKSLAKNSDSTNAVCYAGEETN